MSLPQPSLPSLPSDTPEFPGSSTSVYTRIARGGNTCWFGPNGTLDRTYIWHAKAEPESKGGIAEILVHERFEKNQRGLKAFSITIAPKGEGAAVAVQNLKMPEAIGKRMSADAYRWARGGVGCAEGDTSWTPVVPPAAPRPTDAKKGAPRKKPELAAPKTAAKAIKPVETVSGGSQGAVTSGQPSQVAPPTPSTPAKAP